jgi:hypothetical protein
MFTNTAVGATGAGFIVSSGTTNGVANFLTMGDSPAVAIGGIVNGLFQTAVTQTSTETRLPTPAGSIFSIAVQATEQYTRAVYYSPAQVGALQANVQFTGGSSDVVAPTCSVASFSPIAVQTHDNNGGISALTVTCTDTGGAGLWVHGAFVQRAGSSDVQDVIFLDANPQNYPFPAQIEASYSVIGVFAVDNAGNAALYGTCGGIAGWDTVCGGGSSSASQVAVSFVALIVLAIFTLFA